MPYKYDLRRFNVINSVSFDHCVSLMFLVLFTVFGIAVSLGYTVAGMGLPGHRSYLDFLAES